MFTKIIACLKSIVFSIIVSDVTSTVVVLLRFSKSCKRSVLAGFVKKSVDSDSVSVLDEGIIHICIVYTGH